MKESITKFDLEAAFKALDEISVPKAKKGIKANKPALTEIFSRKSKFDTLFEEYYDIGNMEDLSDAKDSRAAEVAKAKLARIEKIVDLDAESPEDLLPSYVGKFIMQCPQCMTLFYKNQEDIEESEDDEKTVNVNEVCQHCGNDSGYTLIGKVGEANSDTSDSTEGEEDLDIGLGEFDETSEEETSSEETEGEEVTDEASSEEEFDLDSELEELDFDVEDDETDAKESWFHPSAYSVSLQENLVEDADTEVSADEFEQLINSPEFKKPISDSEVRAMLNDASDLDEDINNAEELEEGIFDKLKDKVTKAVDKVTSGIKSREAKADWILANAKEDYNKVKADAKGQLVPDEKNQRFLTFVVIGFTGKYSNGKTITMAPSFNNKDLIIGENGIQEKKRYKDAENIAKGWSQSQGNGPAFIYLAKNKDDDNAVFLCEYFQGELENDQLEKYFNVVKKDLEGAKLMAKGGMNQDNEENNESDSNLVPALKIKKGMHIKLEDGEACEVLEIGKSKLSAKKLSVKVKLDDNTVETFSLNPDEEIAVIKDEVTTEAFDTNLAFVEDLNELQESELESLISESLIEAYENVAGFKISGCSYLNEKLNIDGTIYFSSGNKRKTTYTFTEARHNKDKISLCGINEKLGSEKRFKLTGYVDNANKTFITEAFKRIK